MRAEPNAHAPGLESASFDGMRVLVLGLGRFDGGVGTTRFLCAQGASVLVSDPASPASLHASLEAIRAAGAEERLGPQTPPLLDGCDAVIANPGVPFDHPVLEAADERGIPVTSEINLVLARTRAPVIGVTGTKGKSTTATLLATMLEATGHTVHCGGNIGRSLIADLATIPADHVVVLELSSFQLWWARRIQRSPRVAVLTNLMSDHLDRHGDQAHYARAKRALFDYQGAHDIAVLPTQDAGIEAAGWPPPPAGTCLTHGPGGDVRCHDDALVGPGGQADLRALRLPGVHNRRNAAAAAAACLGLGRLASAGSASKTWRGIAEGLARTEALPHRLQTLATIGGVRYVDDSIATHPEAARAALEAFEAPLIVLAGGKDKGISLASFADALAARAKAVVTLGATGPAIAARIGGRCPTITVEGGMDDALRAATSQAAAGDVVLLSPGCSSLDQYDSFAARGDAFGAAVRAIEASPKG